MAFNLVSSSSMSLTLGSSLSTFRNVSGGTMMAWVRIPATLATTETTIASFSTGTSTSNARATISFRGQVTKFRASARRSDADSVQTVDGTTTVVAATIYHVCGVYNYSGTALKIYVNGVLENTTTVAGWTANTSNTASLAARIGSTGAGGAYFNGAVSDVRTYNLVLTDQEIFNIYSARGSDSIIYGMVDRWKCTDGAQTATVTYSPSVGPNQGAATPVNSPTFYDTNLNVVTHQMVTS